jgi:hypothetical protein
MFQALGNNRPQILIKLEDCVLQTVIDISEGKPHEVALDCLHSQLAFLEKDLANDKDAMTWFDLSTAATSGTSAPPLFKFPSPPLSGLFF